MVDSTARTVRVIQPKATGVTTLCLENNCPLVFGVIRGRFVIKLNHYARLISNHLRLVSRRASVYITRAPSNFGSVFMLNV